MDVFFSLIKKYISRVESLLPKSTWMMKDLTGGGDLIWLRCKRKKNKNLYIIANIFTNELFTTINDKVVPNSTTRS